jgi:predicted RNA-binding protein
MELDETYPLAQHEAPRTIDLESKKLIFHTLKTYIKSHKYDGVIIHLDHRVIGEESAKRIINLCDQLGVSMFVGPVERIDPKSKHALEEFRCSLIEAHKILLEPTRPEALASKGDED